MNDFQRIKTIIGKKNLLKFFLIITFNIFQTFIEILSLGLIVPIMSVIIKPSLIYEQKILAFLYNFLGSSNNIDFLSSLLLILFLLYTVKLILSITFKYFHVTFVFSLVRFVTTKIIKKYLSSNYEFYIKNKNTKLISTLYNEASSFVDFYISPLIVIASEAMFALSIFFLLMLTDAKSTLIISSLFLIFVILFLLSTRERIKNWGKERQSLAEKLLKNLSEIFDGIKIIKIFQKENFFTEIFKNNQKKMQSLLLKNDVVLFLPRVLLEYLVIIFIIIILTLSIGMESESGLLLKIPIIALYAAAAIKLIPSASKIMVSFQNLKFGIAVINRVYEEITSIENIEQVPKNKLIDFKKIVFKNISYSYENDNQIINQLSFEINKGEFIGIIVESGSGKTTLLNIILGLLKPKSGEIIIDGEIVTKYYSSFKNLFSFVGQDVYLFDDTLAKNVALEEEEKNIDYEKLKNVIKLSQLSNFIEKNKEFENLEVGEKGLSISGGQKQRIAVARSFYKNSPLLVFDEATSNLDQNTEKKLIESLTSMKGKKTIIFVSHRIESLKLCDKLYKMNSNKNLTQL